MARVMKNTNKLLYLKADYICILLDTVADRAVLSPSQ